MLNNYTTLEHTDENETEVTFNMDVSNKGLTVNGRRVTAIQMYASTEGYGDMGVLWEADNDADYTHNTTLLMRDIHSDDANTDTMGKFYWDGEFTDTLRKLLFEAGFSTDAANDVDTSEWGMQEAGRASYDANLCGNEILAVYGKTCTYYD